MMALDIGPRADHATVFETLLQGQQDGSWEYEEGRLNPAWISVASGDS
jgi:hypothetical protein